MDYRCWVTGSAADYRREVKQSCARTLLKSRASEQFRPNARASLRRPLSVFSLRREILSSRRKRSRYKKIHICNSYNRRV